MIAQKQVSYCSELDALLGVVNVLVSDVLGGKAPAQIVSDAAAPLLAALTGLGQVASELSDHVALDNTVAMKVGELKRLLAPQIP